MRSSLAVIMAVDLTGYCRLMGANEVQTYTSLKEVEALVLKPRVAERNGQIIKKTGDGFLARFDSVIDGTKCAVDIQRDMVEWNSNLDENESLRFRIGIHLGETMIEADDVFGTGVNIASRLEQLADPGGILVSDSIYRQFSGQKLLRFEHIGKKHLKNISEPVQVYRVLSSTKPELARDELKRTTPRVLAFVAISLAIGVWFFLSFGFFDTASNDTTTATPELAAAIMPAIPTVAVMPFDDSSDTAESAHFANGMTDDIITDLSKLAGVLVVSGNSTYKYKGRVIEPQTVFRELGAEYLLEGSIRRDQDGEALRINAQLVHAEDGVHVWAERYDATISDMFSVQDQLTNAIVEALTIKISDTERRRLSLADTESIPAYEAFLRGWESYQQNTSDDLATALQYFRRAVELDPSYGRAFAAIGHAYLKSWAWGWEASVGETYLTAPRLAKQYRDKAMQFEPTALAFQLSAEIATYERDFETALDAARTAVEFSPNDTHGLYTMAEALIFAGRPDEAEEYLERAFLRDPLNRAYGEFLIGLARFGEDRFEEAVEHFEVALKGNPDDFAPAAPLAAAHAYLGNETAMREALDIYRKDWAEANLAEFRIYWPYKSTEDEARILDGLRIAGMPEE